MGYMLNYVVGLVEERVDLDGSQFSESNCRTLVLCACFTRESGNIGVSCRKKQMPIDISLNIRWTFTPRVCHQEGKTSWTSIWEKAKWQRILSGEPIKEELKKETVPTNPWRSYWPPVRTRKLLLQERMVVPSHMSCSDTPPLKKFLNSIKHCVPCNVYTKKLEKNHSCTLIRTNTNNGSWHKVHPLHGGIDKVPGGLLKNSESQRGRKQSLGNERRDPFIDITLTKTAEDGFQEFNFFCESWSCTADGGLLLSTGGVKTTPQMTLFRDVQQAIIMATVSIDDDKIKSDYDMKKTENYVCVVKPND